MTINTNDERIQISAILTIPVQFSVMTDDKGNTMFFNVHVAGMAAMFETMPQNVKEQIFEQISARFAEKDK